MFLEYCRGALALLDEAECMLAVGHDTLRGHIRIAAPSDLGRMVLRPWLDAFQAANPALTISLQLSDRVSDLMRDPVDLALRYGVLDDSSLISQHVAANRHVCVAAPAYLERHGRPRTPHELLQHNCLLFHLKRGLHHTWRFQSGSEHISVKVRGDRSADDGAVVREWAVAGLGIAIKSQRDVHAEHRAHFGQCIRLAMRIHPGVLHRTSFAKYAAAFL